MWQWGIAIFLVAVAYAAVLIPSEFLRLFALLLLGGAGLVASVILAFTLVRSAWFIADDGKTYEARFQNFKIIAACLGTILAILWIGQGVLATQLDIGLSGKASYPERFSGEKGALVVVSLTLRNPGIRQTPLSNMELTVCADGCQPSRWEGVPAGANLGSPATADALALGFGAPAFGNSAFEKSPCATGAYATFSQWLQRVWAIEVPRCSPEFGGNVNAAYVLSWGTQESRQIAFELPEARFYEVQLSIATAEPGSPGLVKWRSSRIIPMEHRYSEHRDVEHVETKGESPEIEKGGGDTRSTFDLLKKLLGGGEK